MGARVRTLDTERTKLLRAAEMARREAQSLADRLQTANEDLARALQSADEARAFAESSADHLRGLIDDVLDLSRIEAGRLAVGCTVSTTRTAVASAIEHVREQAAAKKIVLEDRCEGEPDALFFGDAHRVQQVLVNLLSNATKFTPEGGRISVQCGTMEFPTVDLEARSRGGWTFFAVEDTGVGITPEMLERIFQPFVQGDGGYTRTHPGPGLGLTIGRRLARLMGGDLIVESVQGEGSRFTLWLPAGEQGGATRDDAPRVPGTNRMTRP